MSTEEKTLRGTGALLDHAYDGLLPVALFCGLVGMIFCPLPAVVVTLVTNRVFYPLFIVAPILIYLLMRRLKAGRDLRAFFVNAAFSLAGTYLTALSCQAAMYVKTYSMSVFSVPIVTMLSLGKRGVLPASVSAYVFPLLFTVLGAAVVWELLFETESDEM